MNSALKGMPLVAVIALAMAGCARDGFYHDRNLDYAEAEESAPLVLPDARNANRYRDAMPVPEVSGTRPAEDGVVEAPLPQALSPGRAREPGYVERREIGSDAWLVVGADPAAIWPELERFVQRRGLDVTARDPGRGLLETEEARFRVRQGLRSGDSEILCERGGATDTGCLTALERHFQALSASSSVASLTAQRPERLDRARFEQRGDDWRVILPFGVDRVWAELSHQLEIDFAIEGRRELLDRDPSGHAFLVDYLTLSEREQGLLSSLASLDLGDEPRRVRLALEALGPEETVLRATGVGEAGELSDQDQRELLERVAGLLR
ncbi:lipoprotein, NlpB [Halomonas aestuarii]|uniref:Lipoprotein, NlpB n=1 Tax=Halomonas aestuarii TaxID=1897729 RepID=A0A1J0VHD9_9GAMM|nr:lipoprotein, NlpB [Halomonas aestuarii]APE31426.1 lipoprotein, NlpB [Halomonas aestuarii]